MNGDDQKLFDENLSKVKRIVYRIAVHLPPNVDKDDLVNAGVIGLIEAINRFDPGRDNEFMTYASFRIRGSVLSELRSRDFHSRAVRGKIRKVQEVTTKLSNELGGEPEDAEIALALNISLEELSAIKSEMAISILSFEETPHSEYNGIFNPSALNAVDIEEEFNLKQTEHNIAQAIELLKEREQLVLSLYYWDGLTMKEIGKVMGITESCVSQIHAKAIIALRGKLERKYGDNGNGGDNGQ